MPDTPLTRRFWLGQMAAYGLAFGQERVPHADPLIKLKRGHPRLILPETDMGRVRALVRDHPLARKLRDNLERDGEKLQTASPVDYKSPGQRLLTQSKRVLERVYTLALLYRLDAKPQYLERAVKELRAAALFPDWNPSHFLDVAEMTHAFAIGYDWLYPALSEVERDWIRGALVEKGLDPALAAYKQPDTWVNDDNTWNLVCNSGVSIGALALAEEEPDRARRVLDSAFDSIRRGVATYGPDGGWPEGPGYWHYGTRYVVHLLASLESAVDNDRGLSRSRGFDRTGRFRVYFTGPFGKTFNFGDSGDDASTAPEMFWLARRFDQPAYAWQEQIQTERSPRTDPLDIVWFYKDGKRPQGDEWPLDAYFSGIQTAFMRTSWEDPNAIFLGVKGGDNDYSHAHLDLGSFVLDAGGVRWGYVPDLDSNTEAHNTVLINNENQSRKAQARITRHEFGADLSWVQIDLTNAYPGKVKQLQRRIGIAQKQAVIILDTLSAEQPVEPLWGMLTEAEITLNGQSAALRKNDWTLSCEIRSPHHAVFDIVSTPTTKRLVARMGAKVNELSLNIVLTPHRTGQSKPVISKDFPV